MRSVVSILIVGLTMAACSMDEKSPNPDSIVENVILKELEALDSWSAGNPPGFTVNMDSSITYMDDIAAQIRLEGLDAVQNYMNSLDGNVPKHDYELIDPKVQVNGTTAVLTFRYQGSIEGQMAPTWKATSVYAFRDSEWKMIHAHWSVAKD